MLIKRILAAPTTARTPATQSSCQFIRQAAKVASTPSHHRRKQLYHYRKRQHHQIRQKRCILLIIALILLQQAELHTCHQIATRGSKRSYPATAMLTSSRGASDFMASTVKRSGGGVDVAVGQPEEIFTVNDQMESNYDEYPMIVPKRAALLLDRLMVALHHALEKERNGQPQRIGELNDNTSNGDGININRNKDQSYTDKQDDDADSEQGAMQSENMYGDDPTVLMDYDFKDLNSINRATGETLMEKSFQRRANMGLDLGGPQGVALLTSGAATRTASNDAISAAGGGGGGGVGLGVSGGRSNVGRMYWRCYFNAVSCF